MMYAEVALDQHSYGVATVFFAKLARCRAGAAFPFETNHSRSAADVTFGDRTAMCTGHRCVSVGRRHMKTIDVVQVAVPGFGDDGKRPPVLQRKRGGVLELPGDHGVANDSDAVGVGDH